MSKPAIESIDIPASPPGAQPPPRVKGDHKPVRSVVALHGMNHGIHDPDKAAERHRADDQAMAEAQAAVDAEWARELARHAQARKPGMFAGIPLWKSETLESAAAKLARQVAEAARARLAEQTRQAEQAERERLAQPEFYLLKNIDGIVVGKISNSNFVRPRTRLQFLEDEHKKVRDQLAREHDHGTESPELKARLEAIQAEIAALDAVDPERCRMREIQAMEAEHHRQAAMEQEQREIEILERALLKRREVLELRGKS